MTIDISKYKIDKSKQIINEEVDIEIYPENIKDEPNSALIFLKDVTSELSQLRQENMLLRMNIEEQQYIQPNNTFITIFDNDFRSLFD